MIEQNSCNVAEILDYSFLPSQKWFSLQEACMCKGLNYKTACNKPYLKPNGGKPEAIIGGKRVFSRETIINWLTKTDAELQPDEIDE